MSRKAETALFVFGFGLAIIFFVLAVVVTTIPGWLAVPGIGIGAVLMVASLTALFWPSGQRLQRPFRSLFRRNPVSTDQDEPSGEGEGVVTPDPDVVQFSIVEERSRIREMLHTRVAGWDFKSITSNDPYFEVFVELINGTPFRVRVGRDVVGFINFDDRNMSRPPVVVGSPSYVTHGHSSEIRLRQSVSEQDAARIDGLLHDFNEGATIGLGAVTIGVEVDTEQGTSVAHHDLHLSGTCNIVQRGQGPSLWREER